MTRNDQRQKEPNWKGWAIGVGLFAIILVLGFAGVLVGITWPIEELSVAKAGVFGDSFGALNTLFSGLTFAGLVITLLMQRYDLKLQREDISETRREIRTQNFESTFFQMVRLHNDIVGAMRTDYRDERNTEDGPDIEDVPVTGRDCFLEYERRLESWVCHFGTSKQDLPGIRQAYDSFWRANQQALGHYFRHLYRIFKFIDEEGVNDKHRYSGIARAPLSDLELLLLYYSCLVPQGERFKPLAEEYALFDNLPIDLLFDKCHLAFVDPRAWGGQEGAVRKRLERLRTSRVGGDSGA